MPTNREILRRVAVLGTCAVLIGDMIRSWPMTGAHGWSLAFLMVAVVAVAVVMRWLMAPAWDRLARSPDVLVPLGLLIFASGAVEWLARVPGIAAAFAASKEFKIGSFNILTISLAWLAGFIISLVYAAWMTQLVLDVEGTGQADAAAAFRSGLKRWLLVLGIVLINWIVATVFSVIEISTMMAAGAAAGPVLGWFGAVVMFGLLLGFSVLAYLWNLATAALLPVAMISRRGFVSAVGVGIRASWRGKRFWWQIVLAQLLLLGFWFFMTYHYEHTTSVGGESTSYNFSFRFNHFWVGGYEHECRWYGEFMKLVGAQPVALVGRLLGLLFGVLAIAVKIGIVQRLPRAT